MIAPEVSASITSDLQSTYTWVNYDSHVLASNFSSDEIIAPTEPLYTSFDD